MSKGDSGRYALIVGIRDYPDEPEPRLEGPVIDAREMEEWLVDPNGGRVPKSNVICLTSPLRQPRDPRVSEDEMRENARPSEAEIESEFRKLHRKALRNGDLRTGPRIGKRLYVYFSGHGFGPSKTESALCAANYHREWPGNHVLARYNVEWFVNAGAFDEVLLFADSCRTRDTTTHLNMKYAPKYAAKDSPPVKALYLYAAQWGQRTVEVEWNGGKRGAFTLALLAGLRGAAADSLGDITSTSLVNYLDGALPGLLQASDRENPAIAKVPYRDIEPFGTELMIVERAAAAPAAKREFEIAVRIPLHLAGATITIFDARLEKVVDKVVTAEYWKLRLPRGLYQVRLEHPSITRSREFEVSGAEEETKVDAI